MLTEGDIKKLIAPYFVRERVKLCGVKISGRASNPQIQVLADLEEGNITIYSCVRISKELRDLLDMQKWRPRNFQLNVSSPGIGFPMFEDWQFRKNIGRLIKKKDADGVVKGRIKSITRDGLAILVTSEEEIEFNLRDLYGAKVVLEMPGKGSKSKGSKRK